MPTINFFSRPVCPLPQPDSPVNFQADTLARARLTIKMSIWLADPEEMTQAWDICRRGKPTLDGLESFWRPFFEGLISRNYYVRFIDNGGFPRDVRIFSSSTRRLLMTGRLTEPGGEHVDVPTTEFICRSDLVPLMPYDTFIFFVVDVRLRVFRFHRKGDPPRECVMETDEPIKDFGDLRRLLLEYLDLCASLQPP